MKFVKFLASNEKLPSPEKFSHVQSRAAKSQPTSAPNISTALNPKLAIVSQKSNDNESSSIEANDEFEEENDATFLATTESDMVIFVIIKL